MSCVEAPAYSRVVAFGWQDIHKMGKILYLFQLLQDRVRTDTYRAAIMQHQSYIADKVILIC